MNPRAAEGKQGNGTALALSVRDRVETPAFVVDERIVLRALAAAAELRTQSGCRVLYTLKAQADAFVLDLMRPWVDGFSVSSLFEARLARAAVGDGGSVHLTTPGLRRAELSEIGALCDVIAFNSLSQFQRCAPQTGRSCRPGLRINPGLSVVADARYDPCRPHSKLGTPLAHVRRVLDSDPALLDGVTGVHFHTNRGCADFRPLDATVRRIEDHLAGWLPRLEWMNLGGGYALEPGVGTAPFVEIVKRLRSVYGLEVLIEPGAALVRQAGFLVAEVVDLFPSSGKTVAVLDTTVNHWPEIFEYQLAPAVADHNDAGEHPYVLAGCSCLAGDVMGECAFDAPLAIGSRVVLPNVGAYAMVKAHTFNGINLPAVYSIGPDGQLVLRRRFTFEDFASRTGVVDGASH